MAQQARLKKVFVGGLFGRFDYSIDFSENGRRESGITIITAPNGYGKSTLLRLIDDLVGGRYAQLSRTTFAQLVIETSDGRGVMVERSVKSDEADVEETMLRFTQVRSKRSSKAGVQKPWEIKITPMSDPDIDDDMSAHSPPYMQMERIVERELGLRRIGPREWQDPNDGRTYNRDQLALLFGEHQAGGSRHRRSEPTWLTEFRADVTVLYIPANRLRAALRSSGPRRPRGGEMVEVISDRVLDQIRKFNAKYAGMGRMLEQDFPSRVIDAMGSGEKIEHGEIMRLMDEVRRQELEYQELGLLSEVQTRRVNLAIKDPSALLVLGIYLTDIGRKLQSLKETAERLRIFIETLNAMLLFKKLKITPDIGFQVIGHSGKPIPLRALSSGEQHLIVLLGEVIFESVESGVVLLDEPEISFHPEWQELFPEVLAKVVRLNGCMIVMATHSPTLIQDKWDSVVELADQVAR
jgi:ABC-type transport system involved in cytochrome c biogenesis ATPase subunit